VGWPGCQVPQGGASPSCKFPGCWGQEEQECWEGGKEAGGRKQPHCHPPNYWLGWQGRRRKADIVYLIKSKQQFAAASLPLAMCRTLPVSWSLSFRSHRATATAQPWLPRAPHPFLVLFPSGQGRGTSFKTKQNSSVSRVLWVSTQVSGHCHLAGHCGVLEAPSQYSQAWLWPVA
jgi:hypothetical protein